MARPKAEPVRPTTMKELKDTLWKAADKLRGSLEASDYKDVILGLVFLKYVSDSFEERRGQIRAELEADGGYSAADIEESLEDKDEYAGAGVFWVPVNARWQFLAERAKGTETKTIGELEIVREAAGLRPSRKGGVRIEAEEWDAEKGQIVIHNYGAGGTGYQSGLGMAMDAVQLYKQKIKASL